MKVIVIRPLIIGFLLACTMQMVADTGYAKIDPNSVVGVWLLDEGKGDEAKDTSGNGNDGEIDGAEWTAGKFGNALEFDGQSHVNIPASKTTDDYVDGFTYLLWVQPTAVPPNVNTRIIERDWHNPTIQMGPADFYGSIAINGDQAATNVRGGEWEMGEWSFVALTYDGAVIELYVDGEMVNSKNVGKADENVNFTAPPNEGAIWLATWKAPGWDFTGLLDDVGVFNAPLGQDDLNTIMANGLQEALSVSSLGKIAVTWGDLKAQ